jgi:hypothetical protein
VDDQIVAPFCIDEVIVFVIGIFQKVRNDIFMELFRFSFIYPVQQFYKVSFKAFNIASVRLDFQKRFIERFSRFEYV